LLTGGLMDLVLMITRSFGVVFLSEASAIQDQRYQYLIATYALSGSQGKGLMFAESLRVRTLKHEQSSGILIGLIYFSEPAVVASAKELIHYLKKRRSEKVTDEEKGVREYLNVGE
jgi:acetoacetate decarboxylase